MSQIRDEHITYVTELARVSNEITTTTSKDEQNDKEYRQHRDLALRGLKLLSSWNSTVTELVGHYFLFVGHHLLFVGHHFLFAGHYFLFDLL